MLSLFRALLVQLLGLRDSRRKVEGVVIQLEGLPTHSFGEGPGAPEHPRAEEGGGNKLISTGLLLNLHSLSTRNAFKYLTWL